MKKWLTREVSAVFVATGALMAAGVMAEMRPAVSESATAPNAASEAMKEVFAVDPVHSTALFRVHHLGAGQFWGRFNDLSGEIVLDDAGAPVDVSMTIATQSVDTNNERLDQHLRSPDFFNAREYPEMSFTSMSIEHVEGNMYRLKGDLTIRGETKEITAEFEHTGTRELQGRKRTGFEARFTVMRSEFNVAYGVDNGMLGDETKVIVGLEAIRQE